MAGKGDRYRPVDNKTFRANYEAIFGERKLNVWDKTEEQPPTPKTEKTNSATNRRPPRRA
jgi:hypothetical protein